MDITLFMESGIFNWLIMPLLIFIARICDMTLGTLRIVLISKNKKLLAPIVGFFEVLIWIIIVRQIITSTDNLLWIIAYAAGFATGTYMGLYFAEKMKMGEVLFRIITKKDSTKLIAELKEKGYGITLSHSAERKERANIIYTVVRAKDMNAIGQIINKHNPGAFYTIEDVRQVSEGVFPKRNATHNNFNPFKRKGK